MIVFSHRIAEWRFFPPARRKRSLHNGSSFSKRRHPSTFTGVAHNTIYTITHGSAPLLYQGTLPMVNVCYLHSFSALLFAHKNSRPINGVMGASCVCPTVMPLGELSLCPGGKALTDA